MRIVSQFRIPKISAASGFGLPLACGGGRQRSGAYLGARRQPAKWRPESLLLIKCKERRIFSVWKHRTQQQRASDDPQDGSRSAARLSNTGDRFKFFFHPDGVMILPKIPTARLKGILAKPAKAAIS